MTITRRTIDALAALFDLADAHGVPLSSASVSASGEVSAQVHWPWRHAEARDELDGLAVLLGLPADDGQGGNYERRGRSPLLGCRVELYMARVGDLS